MPSTLTMPKLSPTMEGGTIVKWHVKEGDEIKAGDLLFEVATDKATVEHNALDDGFLRKILVQEGAEALVNEPVAIFTETKDESITGYQPEGVKPKAEEKAAAMQKTEETKKEEVKPTQKGSGLSQPGFQPEQPLEDYQFEFDISLESRLPASPLAKKLAEEKGLDISTIKGSGPSGRIMSRDLDLAQSQATTSFGSRQMPELAPGTYEEIPISPMRKAIGERLQASKTFIPHFYVQQDVNIEPVFELREQLKKEGVKVTFNDFVLRATALALKEHLVLNRGFDTVKNTIIQFKTIDIAVAVSINEGLITPIIRHADYKNLGQLSVEIKQLALRAKEGKLKPHEYRGGSFTISNLGMFGIHDFQAVINPPQVAILAIGGIRECPVVKNGHVAVGKQMMLSLSSDHRVVDGADAAKFIKTVQRLLENPAILLI